MATSETDPSDSIGVTASATDTTTTVGTTSTIGTTSKMTDISADIRNELRRSNKNSRRTKSAAFEKFQINSSKALRMEKCNSDKMPTRTIVRRRSTPEKSSYNSPILRSRSIRSSSKSKNIYIPTSSCDLSAPRSPIKARRQSLLASRFQSQIQRKSSASERIAMQKQEEIHRLRKKYVVSSRDEDQEADKNRGVGNYSETGGSSGYESMMKEKEIERRKIQEMMRQREKSLEEQSKSKPRWEAPKETASPVTQGRVRRMSLRWKKGGTSKGDVNSPKLAGESLIVKKRAEEKRKMKEAMCKREEALKELERENRPKIKNSNNEDEDVVVENYQRVRRMSKRFTPEGLATEKANSPRSAGEELIAKQKAEEMRKLREAVSKRDEALEELEKEKRPTIKQSTDEDDVLDQVQPDLVKKRSAQFIRNDSNEAKKSTPKNVLIEKSSSSKLAGESLIAKQRAEEKIKMKEALSKRDEALKEIERENRPLKKKSTYEDVVVENYERVRRMSKRFTPAGLAIEKANSPQSAGEAMIAKQKAEEMKKLKEAVSKREDALKELEKENRPKIKESTDTIDLSQVRPDMVKNISAQFIATDSIENPPKNVKKTLSSNSPKMSNTRRHRRRTSGAEKVARERADELQKMREAIKKRDQALEEIEREDRQKKINRVTHNEVEPSDFDGKVRNITSKYLTNFEEKVSKGKASPGVPTGSVFDRFVDQSTKKENVTSTEDP